MKKFQSYLVQPEDQFSFDLKKVTQECQWAFGIIDDIQPLVERALNFQKFSSKLENLIDHEAQFVCKVEDGTKKFTSMARVIMGMNEAIQEFFTWWFLGVVPGDHDERKKAACIKTIATAQRHAISGFMHSTNVGDLYTVQAVRKCMTFAVLQSGLCGIPGNGLSFLRAVATIRTTKNLPKLDGIMQEFMDVLTAEKNENVPVPIMDTSDPYFVSIDITIDRAKYYVAQKHLVGAAG